jgi:hypothetical protein
MWEGLFEEMKEERGGGEVWECDWGRIVDGGTRLVKLDFAR